MHGIYPCSKRVRPLSPLSMYAALFGQTVGKFTRLHGIRPTAGERLEELHQVQAAIGQEQVCAVLCA